MITRPGRKPRPSSTTVQSGATSLNAPVPKLPHERDESPESAAKPDPKVVQGYADVSSGLVDTEAREHAARSFDRLPTKR